MKTKGFSHCLIAKFPFHANASHAMMHTICISFCVAFHTFPFMNLHEIVSTYSISEWGANQ